MDDSYLQRLVISVESIAKSLSTLVEDAKASKEFKNNVHLKLTEFEEMLNNFKSDPFGIESKQKE